MASQKRLGDFIRSTLPGRTKGLVIGGATSAGSDRFEKPLFELRSAGLQCLTATTLPTPWVEPNLVDEIAKMATRTGVQFIVAAGGGTTIDTAKAVASVIGLRQPCSSWMTSQPTSPPPLPLIMIPTTVTGGLAAGSNRCNINMPDEQLLTSLKVSKPESLLLHVDTSLLSPSKTNKDECSTINGILAAAIDLVLVRSKQVEDGVFESKEGKENTVRLARLLIKLQLFMEEQRKTQLNRPPPPINSPLSISPLILKPEERNTLLAIALEIGALSNHAEFDCSPLSTTTKAIHPAHFRLVTYIDLLSSVSHDGFSLISNGRKATGQGLLGEELATILQTESCKDATLDWLKDGDDELLKWIYQDMPNLREGVEGLDEVSLLAKHKARVYQALSTSSPTALMDSLSASFHVSEPQYSRDFMFSDIWPVSGGEKEAKDQFLKLLTPLGDPYA